ncbi:MAG: aminotransferase class I/II-fold pyridoxal phosphate-dependent enzyme [Kiloniellales bacterium]|nr:aminotransferase class I/II-fold pyridoxal phosphate-dependent enzyme [Kiloniellales bacterium]
MLDFRSDTVTKPTPAMMAAIARAELGDAARGDDPTTNELEAFAARLAGKEAALFTPSGTMANLAALLTHLQPGEEVIVDETAHIYNSEAGSMAAVAGAIARPLRSEGGLMDPSRVAAAIRSGERPHVAPTGLICLENTQNVAGGIVLPPDRMAAIRQVALDAGLPAHLDGARLFNAAAYLDRPIADFCRHADTVMLALSKGLGAPVGSLLLGSAAFIAQARKKARMLGGGMRQAGLIAAAALVALDDPLPRLRRDHRMAKRLAEGLAAIDESLVSVERVQTNIVNCFVDRFASDADAIVRALKAEGVSANYARSKIRFVTHAHIDEEAVDACLAAVRKVIGKVRRAA